VPSGAGAPTIFSDTPLPRVLNVALTDVNAVVLPQTRALAPERRYLVRIDVGPQAAESVVINPSPIRPEDLDKPDAEGWWLAVIVAGGDVDVEPEVHRVFLPLAGPSW